MNPAAYPGPLGHGLHQTEAEADAIAPNLPNAHLGHHLGNATGPHVAHVVDDEYGSPNKAAPPSTPNAGFSEGIYIPDSVIVAEADVDSPYAAKELDFDDQHHVPEYHATEKPSMGEDDRHDDDDDGKKKCPCFGKKGKKEKEEKPKMVPFGQLFRFADGKDKILMIVGSIFAAITGLGLPGFSWGFGELLNDLGEGATNDFTKWVVFLVIIGVVVWISAWISLSCWILAGERQIMRMKVQFFASILRQEVGWYDTHKTGEIGTKLSTDTIIVQKALSEKMSNLIQYLSCFIFSFAFAFWKSWKLTLVMCAMVPLLVVAGGLMAKVITESTSKGQEAYSKAGAVAQEALSSIRTVHAFNGCAREIKRYDDALLPCQKIGEKKSLFAGMSLGITMFLLFATYSLAFWFGSILIIDGDSSGGEIISVFFAVLIGAFQLGQAAPIFSVIAEALGAAYGIYDIIDREPLIDPNAGTGVKLESLQGKIEFKHVGFTYPARQDLPIFDDLNLTIEPSSEVALVGHSGSGKSSVVSLIERFYDPAHGEILIDGVDLRTLDLEWWRSQVSIVTQEPTLFTTSVMTNIKAANPDATDEEVIAACKDAHIHDVISKLPQGYNTPVGEGGCQLSGGQKQRVAIARALIRDPKVLLLDEATSALDRQSEMLVQDALANVMRGRTTVVIAHRLVTIKDADQICFIKPRDPNAEQGSPASFSRLMEQGTYDELVAKGGEFAGMVKVQEREEKIGASPVLKTTPSMFHNKVQELEQQELVEIDIKEDEEGTQGKKEKVKKKKGTIRRIAKLNKPEWPWIVAGIIGATIAGASYPVYSILFSEVLALFYKDNDTIKSQVWIWCVLFLALGLMNFISLTTKVYCLGVAAERLTRRIRGMLFQSIIRNEIGWFDLPGHESGALCSALSADTQQIHHLWGTNIGNQFQAFVCLLAGIIIAFTASWKLTLVVMCTIPPVIFGGYMNMKILGGFVEADGEQYAKAAQVASESTSGCRTVFAFNMQNHQVQQYKNILAGPAKKASKKGFTSGFFYGFSQFTIFGAFALGLWYGGELIKDGELDFSQVLKATMAVLMGAMGFGEVYSQAGDNAEATEAACRVFEHLDKVPAIDALSVEGIPVAECGPQLELQNVDFCYPSRPDIKVLNGLDLGITPGQRVALLGSTGCGKSTIIALLTRFYDPSSGEVRMDGKAIPTLTIQDWRRKIGYVQQEPILFDTSIMENIKYSNPEASDEEVIAAAKKAQIHDIIVGLPERYDTNVGPKGSQLSGGQKQRVAIARSILNNPGLLLLDEATSALDNKSEKEVQKALDSIIESEGMTVVMIAHRLSTITNCDHIIIMKDGKIVERGSHEELYAMGGEYTIRYDAYYGTE